MAGDQFNIRVSSWYKKNGATPNSPNSIATDLVTGLINSLTGDGGPVHGMITNTQLQSSGIIPTSVGDFLNDQPAPGSSKPKAYLNWILLDEQFKYVEGSSGAEQVPDESAFGTAPNNIVHPHIKNDLTMTKNGYLYVFVSNETPNIDVYFDNLQITHTRGPILEDTHYYPFGLTLAGISSKALQFGNPENKIKYNNMELQNGEFSDGSGLEMYEYKYRFYDHQIGRFMSQDRLADKYAYYSPYQFAGNEVPNAIDLDGLEPLKINEGTKNLVLILQGYGSNPPNGATQASNAAKTNPGLAPDNALGSITSTGPSLQVGIYASSQSDNTKNDVLSTIKDFRSQSPDGNLILIGHSGGADNIVELAKDNKDVKIDLMITLDVRDPKKLGWTDTNIPSNVKNEINYYQNTDKLNLISDRKMDFSSKTNGVNILSPGSNHRSIDNDQLPNVIKDINNQLMNRNPVQNAASRVQPVYDPKKSNSDPIPHIPIVSH